MKLFSIVINIRPIRMLAAFYVNRLMRTPSDDFAASIRAMRRMYTVAALYGYCTADPRGLRHDGDILIRLLRRGR